MLSEIVVKRINSEHVFKPFDCGNQDLNDFLLNDSKMYLENLLAVTYVFETDEDTVAYFSVSNDKISVTDTKKSVWRKIRSLFSHSLYRRDYPSVKLGRFAVNAKFQNSSVGTHIVDFIKNMFITNNRTGCAFITVDALQSAVHFYLKNDFIFLEDVSNTLDNHTIQMYFNLKNYRM